MDNIKNAEPEAKVTFEKEEMTPEAREKFLDENPTRREVANFVGAYISNEVLPQILDYVNQKDNHNLALISVCQAVLISQGVISKDEMDSLMKNWEKNQKNQGQSSSPAGVVK